MSDEALQGDRQELTLVWNIEMHRSGKVRSQETLCELHKELRLGVKFARVFPAVPCSWWYSI